MKTKKWIKASMLSMMAILLAACASEDIAQDKKKENETEAPKGGVIFAANGPKALAKRLAIDGVEETARAKTRTSFTHTPGNGADAVWTNEDFIWVQKHDGTWVKSTGTTLHDGGTSAEFTLPGSMADYDDGCEVRYTGTKAHYSGALSASAVFIPKEQSRTTANDFTHAGDWGDCGSGKAYNTGNPRKFNFTLVHKPVYLCFLPRCTNAELAPNIRLKGIKITATKNYYDPTSFMADQCDFDGENISSSGGSPFGDTYINVTLSDFPLETEAKQEKNATYLAVRPGKYDFKIEYTIKDPTTNVETVVTDIRTGITLDKGKIYDVTADLSPTMPKYYMWDAKLDYWHGYESEQPTINWGDPGATQGLHYPQNNTDLRWYSESNLGVGVRNDAQTETFKKLPNVNEMLWYIRKGDPHWDEQGGVAVLDGHLRPIGGLWLRKKSAIVAYLKANEGYPSSFTETDMKEYFQWGGITSPHTDFRTGNTQAVGSAVEGNPYNSDYFFLPALGYYDEGKLFRFGTIGYYWSSSAIPSGGNDKAYGVYFYKNGIYMYFTTLRKGGMLAVPFE